MVYQSRGIHHIYSDSNASEGCSIDVTDLSNAAKDTRRVLAALSLEDCVEGEHDLRLLRAVKSDKTSEDNCRETPLHKKKSETSEEGPVKAVNSKNSDREMFQSFKDDMREETQVNTLKPGVSGEDSHYDATLDTRGEVPSQNVTSENTTEKQLKPLVLQDSPPKTLEGIFQEQVKSDTSEEDFSEERLPDKSRIRKKSKQSPGIESVQTGSVSVGSKEIMAAVSSQTLVRSGNALKPPPVKPELKKTDSSGYNDENGHFPRRKSFTDTNEVHDQGNGYAESNYAQVDTSNRLIEDTTQTTNGDTSTNGFNSYFSEEDFFSVDSRSYVSRGQGAVEYREEDETFIDFMERVCLPSEGHAHLHETASGHSLSRPTMTWSTHDRSEVPDVENKSLHDGEQIELIDFMSRRTKEKALVIVVGKKVEFANVFSERKQKPASAKPLPHLVRNPTFNEGLPVEVIFCTSANERGEVLAIGKKIEF